MVKMFREESPGNIKAEPAATEPTIVLKCDDCPYLTIRRDRLEEHRSSHTDVVLNPPRLNCPGCCNYFFHTESLEVHLLRDHQVNSDEINKIMCLDTQPPQQPKTKSRIYIKSVDVLRNPSLVTGLSEFDNNYQEITQFPTNPSHDIQETMDTLPPMVEINNHHQQRQKIYLKNVNELQEQQQTNLFQPDFDQFQNIPFQSPINFPLIQPEYNNNPTNELPETVEPIETLPSMLPPKNKIYIRNVETLIRPDVQKQSQLEGEQPNNNTTFLHLRSVDDINLMNLEEVQSLPPQRNDIVVLLDDYHEEPQITEPFFISQPHVNPIPEPSITSSSPVDVEELEQAVINCLEASEGLKMLAETPGFNIANNNEVANTPYPGIYRTEPVDDSSFYYKNLEENISQLIFSSTNEMQEEPVEVLDTEDPPNSSLYLLQIPEEFEQSIKQTKPDRSEEIPVPELTDKLDNVICLPDESDADECRNGITPPIVQEPQLPRIFVVNNLTETQETPPSHPMVVFPADELPKQVPNKRSRGRPKGGRNYVKDGRDFPFVCVESECPRRFNQKSNLEYHQRCHDADSKGIICPECGTKEMASWNILHTHLWRQHSIDMELYSCSECNFKTPCLSVLKNTHMKIHSEEKAFKCEICEKLYKNQKQLKNHRRRHRIAEENKRDTTSNRDSNNKKRDDLKCRLCDDPGVQFDTEAQMKDHNSQFHRKELERCEECGKSFEKKIDLENHFKKTHGKPKDSIVIVGAEKIEKVFKCDHCPYETRYRNCARRHKMTHSGERKYSCQFCDYSCIQSKSFRSHLQKSHPGNAPELIFTCPHCDYTTINNGQLKFHLAKHEIGDNGKLIDKGNNIILESQMEVLPDQSDDHMETQSLVEEIPDVVDPPQQQFEIIFEVKDQNAITLE